MFILIKEQKMNYLKLEITEDQKGWLEAITSIFSHGEREDKARDDSKKVAHKNAILILEDEFKCEKDKKLELIVFDMEMVESQMVEVSSTHISNKIFVELECKVENKEHAITYICHRLKQMEDDKKVVKYIVEKMDIYSNILNKLLLEVLKEEQANSSS